MSGVFWVASIFCGAMVGLCYARWQGLKPTAMTIGTAIFGLLAVPGTGGRRDILANEAREKYRTVGICFAALWIAMASLTRLA